MNRASRWMSAARSFRPGRVGQRKTAARTRGRHRFRPSLSGLEGRLLLSYSPTVLASSSAFPPGSVLGQLTIDGQGNLYGTAQGQTEGTVFEIAAGTSTVNTLATFNLAHSNGQGGLNGGLLLDGQGNLYGTTQGDGSDVDGTVFEIPAGTSTVDTLASFDGSNGSFPNGSLVSDSQGNLFGTTRQGGAYGYGTVFELAAGATTITTLVSFNGSDGSTQPFVGDGNGANPIGGVVMDSQGNLFGTTSGEGLIEQNAGPLHGTLFVLLKADNYGLQTLHEFGVGDGDDPGTGLLIDTSRSQPGYLYGTTLFGGTTTFERGEVFVYDLSLLGSSNPDSGFSNGYQFGQSDGFGPDGDLALDTSSDTIYGTTDLSLVPVVGMLVPVPTTAFALHVPNPVQPADAYSTTMLDTFPNGTVGGNVINDTGLVRDSQGNLYGTTSVASTVFELQAKFQATTGSMTSSTSTAVYGQPVTFTATVSPAPPDGELVTFLDGTSSVMSVGSTVSPLQSLSGGQAQLTPTLDLGVHAISAVYVGDGIGYLGSTTPEVSLNVVADPTTTAVKTLASPVELGTSVSFTATVSPGGLGVLTPSGLVQFMVDNVPLGAPVALSGGQATSPSTDMLALGWHAVSATFTDSSGHFLGSTALQPVEVEEHTATSLAATAASTTVGTPVTFTATVINLDSSDPVSGTVSFYDGPNLLSTTAVSGGQAVLTTSALAAAANPHLIVAEYNGASFVVESFNSVTVMVVQANATISWANPADIVYGTALSGTQLDATANVPGTFTYTPAAGTVLGAGDDQTLLVSFSPTDTTDYTPASASVAINVDEAATTTALSASMNPTVYGQAVTFTATVAAMAPRIGTPTGSVTFFEGTTALGRASLSGGIASIVLTSIAPGSDPITAAYSGDTNFVASTSAVVSQSVTKDTATTTVTSSANASVFGQSVTFTATVAAAAPGSGTPTGTVTFKDGSTTLGKSTLTGGSASLTTASLAVATHSITVSYGGDGDFLSSASATLSDVVNQAGTTTSLVSATNPSVSGQPVTFTATVSAAAPSSGTPTGTVTFFDGSNSLGTATLSADTASFTAKALPTGGDSITASYGGSGNFTPSTSSVLDQAVNEAATTTAVASATNPSVFGQSVTFMATVTAVAPGSGTPTGTVMFEDGSTTLGTATLSSGKATLKTTALAAGPQTITVSYGGDGNFLTSTSGPLTQTVNQAATTTTVTSSVNPSVFDQSVSFTATVKASAPGSGTPTGSVTFMDGSTSLGTGALSGGTATFSIATLAVESHAITAVYSDDANFLTSTSGILTQTIKQAATTISVTSSANPSVSGQAVTFTATIIPVAPGGGTPTGTVNFDDGSTVLATVTLTNGSASFTTSSLSVGTHSIKVVYGSDANFKASTSAVLKQVVSSSSDALVAARIAPSPIDQVIGTFGDAMLTDALVADLAALQASVTPAHAASVAVRGKGLA